MAHTYATLDEANDYLISGGSTKYASEAAAIKALKLSILESVSRRIESACHRSQFGSGFGPRLGTNRYDTDGGNYLLLRDDLLTATTVTVAALTGDAGSAVVVDTDYYLRNADGYTGPPWRGIVLHGQGGTTTYGTGFRTASILGVWGHSNTTVTSSATTSEALDTSETGVDVSSGTVFSPGMTILVESEQMYVSSISTNTLTVVRAVNGTTAASHSTSAAIGVYTYDARVRDVCLRLFQRRWKARDAGADGTSGALDVPSQQTLEGEDTIIRRGLSDLMLVGMY